MADPYRQLIKVTLLAVFVRFASLTAIGLLHFEFVKLLKEFFSINLEAAVLFMI